jgi:hypothetical protein
MCTSPSEFEPSKRSTDGEYKLMYTDDLAETTKRNELTASPFNTLDKHSSYAHFRKLSGSEQLLLEVECTDKLQRQVDHCNSQHLKNFQLRLMMEVLEQ